MPELGVVLKGYQIDNAMEKAWTEIHSRVIPLKAIYKKKWKLSLEKTLSKVTINETI